MVRKKLGDEGFIDPSAIIGAVVALIILSVGIFAFFVTMNAIDGETNNISDNQTKSTIQQTIQNITGTSNSIFNILGIVIVIGAIMAVLGMVYSYLGPSRDDSYFDSSDSESSSSHESSETPSPIYTPVIPSYVPPKKMIPILTNQS